MKSRWRGAHLPIDGGAGGMGDLPAVASGEGWVLPMSDSLTQSHGQDARVTTDIQKLPTIGRCALSFLGRRTKSDRLLLARMFRTPLCSLQADC